MISFALVSLSFGGCASSTPHTATARDPQPAGASAPSTETHASPEIVAGDGIARDELTSVLDAGFGQFLSHVETEPAREGDRFVGFRIVTFFEGDARFQNVDLHPGDTITHVNGRRIERPDDALAAWNELRVASELVVSFLREGNEREIRFPIIN